MIFMVETIYIFIIKTPPRSPVPLWEMILGVGARRMQIFSHGDGQEVAVQALFGFYGGSHPSLN